MMTNKLLKISAAIKLCRKNREIRVIRVVKSGTAFTAMLLLLCACGGDTSSASDATASPAPATTRDTYYDKFGLWDHDIAAYRRVNIEPCQMGLAEDQDPMRPPADATKLRRYAHLFGDCHRALKDQGAKIGLLRVNDMNLGMTCFALRLADTTDDLPGDCDLESALPGP